MREEFEKWKANAPLWVNEESALEGFKARQPEIDELEAEVNEQHETIMRQKVLLEQARDVISQYASGFTMLLDDIEIALYGEILREDSKEDHAAMKDTK